MKVIGLSMVMFYFIVVGKGFARSSNIPPFQPNEKIYVSSWSEQVSEKSERIPMKLVTVSREGNFQIQTSDGMLVTIGSQYVARSQGCAKYESQSFETGTLSGTRVHTNSYQRCVGDQLSKTLCTGFKPGRVIAINPNWYFIETGARYLCKIENVSSDAWEGKKRVSNFNSRGTPLDAPAVSPPSQHLPDPEGTCFSERYCRGDEIRRYITMERCFGATYDGVSWQSDSRLSDCVNK